MEHIRYLLPSAMFNICPRFGLGMFEGEWRRMNHNKAAELSCGVEWLSLKASQES
jgi:hypothetical protein